MKLAFAIAAVVACFLALHALQHRERWARALAPVRDRLNRFWAYLMAEPGREPVPPQAVAAHPSVKAAMSGPLPPDGEPLSDGEAEALAALIFAYRNVAIPEPADGSNR